MTSRIDPFLALEPFALLKLRQAAAGHDLPSLALPRHAGLVRALTALLRMPAPLTTDAASERARLLAEAPDLAPHVALLECCAERLVDVLAGRALASDVMFPGGDMTLVEPIYRGNRWTDHFNRLTAIAVARAVAVRHAQSPGTPVRVLEVGAGTGGTSATVLTALDPYAAHVVYDYTDVSPGFVQHGLRTHAAHRSFVRGRLLDLEKPPAEQGFDLSAYDVVLGTNVLHATGWIARSLDHVHQVLRPGGLLLLNEITRAGAFATMTFGLLDGWWAFRDAEMRLPDAPLLSPEGWRHALRSADFGAPAVYGWTEPAETSFQCLFVAARQAAAPATTNVTTSVQPVLPEARAAAPPPPSSPSQDLRPMLAERLAGLLGLEPHELSLDRPFAEFGVDSIVAPQFVSLLNRELGSALVPTDVFNHASIDALAAHLGTMTLAAVPGAVVTVPDPVPQTAPAVPAIAVAVNAVSQQPSPVVAADAGPANDDIAVIGLACRFPGARDADAFWRNLLAGHCAITEVPPDRWDGRRDGTTRWGGFLDEYDCFDPEFFNLSWREAEAMSPQQRVFLEQSWHALEHAGYGRRALAGLRCGVFVGAAPDGYGVTRNDSLSALGGSLAILSARISYLLDLKGPSLPVDTACSSSLVAVHLACRSILAGDCDMALAGGVSILMTNPRLHRFLDDAGMLSPTGQCHTFDAAADGFVPGEGCGIVVLKRLDRALADGDTVMAVIRASGVNQDGRTSGITAPSGKAQTALETIVYRSAGIDPAAISLVEAHGTGTQLGDPIEVKALEAAFRPATDRVGYCALGSVKTNIGHTLTAAGVAGLIKVVLALRHGMIPASLHYATDNPEISFAGSPFFVPRQTMPWSASPRLAAVSSFGFSGTNAHVVVGEAPPRPAAAPTPGPRLILLSGRTAEALETSHAALTAWLADNMPDLADLAHTLGHGRGHHEHRLAILVDSIDDLRAGQGRVWRSLPLTLPARDGQDAEMAALLGAAEPDLARIADCYVRGGDGDWSRLSVPNARRIPLPLTPFARLRFATRDLAPTDAPSPVAPRLHPLLRDNASTLDGVAYRLDLDATAPWLRDHRFGGTAVLPAVAYLELVRAATTLAGAQDVAAIEDLHLDHPLTAGTEARIALRSVEGGAAFNVLGAGNDAHAGGRVRFGEPGASAAKIDMVAISARLTAGFSQDQVYARFRSLGFAYGPAFQVIKALRASPTEVLADLAPALPSEAGMVLDPALLDGAVQAAIGLMLAGGEALTSVVPVSVGRATIHGPVRGPCRAYVQAMGGDTDTRRLAVAVIDPDGRALVTLRDLMVRVSAVRSEPAACHAFAPTWDVVAAEPAGRPAAVLLFDRDETIWRALGGASVLVRPGSAFCRLDRLSFAIDPARAEDHSRLLETLRSEGLLPATAWHLWSRPEPVGAMRRSDQATVATALREGPRAVMLLAGAFARLSPVDPVEILYGHAEADPEAPLPALVGGFGAAMLRENPLLRIRPVGLPGVDADRTIANVSVATAQPQAAEHWDAHGARLVRRFTPVDLPRPASLRPRGVFLLTGAKGGIGRHIARHLARHCQARLLLVGRTAPDAAVDELIAAIRATGGDAAYHLADVADPAQAMDAAAAARARFGALHGVIHAAGVTRDRFLLHATEADLDAVLAPKVAGTLALDRATASDDLDLFVCFSSLAGSLGNAGQAGYSAANRFLDAFMAMRTGPGRSLSIGWPYWAEGGLQVDAAEQARRTAATGIRSLETEQGLALFDALAGSARGAVLLLPGDAAAMSAMMDPSATPTNKGRAATETDAANDDAIAAAIAYLRGLLADATAMPADRINPDRPLEQYGIDSILVTRMNAALERDFEAVPKTLFFEHQTLRSAAAYLASRHAAGLTRQPVAAGSVPVPAAQEVPLETTPSPPAPRIDGIAIIGIAGRYPGASTLEAFWDNLRADRDLITEVPPDRWDHEAWFDARPGIPGRSYSRWGGFLDGVDRFDPLFFNIAPGEAAGIDPNERLFLETCWEALENAGHTRASLSRDRDRSVGVYAGVMYGEYQVLAAAAQAAGAGGVGGASPYWSIANRVSYHLDLHGPSVAVDTACSSSLTAIHLACQALATGECTVAIAGGVNLSLHPLKYVGLSQGRFAASDGRCHSFTTGGDGYVPGEGVGAVVLKPLAAALADGDFVHAVIRGWSANHGGKTNGYTVPNPVQQGAVIAAALRKGGVEPASISYVEAHGTGTALGDPIEVAGLAAAFGDDVPRQSCALGSVKANIGHLEAAAGIAGLTRVVLQLQHRTLTPTRRHGADNPNIDFAVTPFRLQYKTEAWDGPTPLRAGLSSFGAGGANAHLVVEEWRTPRADAASGDLPALLVLSARTEAQLRAYAERMAVFLRHSPYRLADVCRTLQVGREAMAVRLAAVVGSLAEAADLLAAHAAGTACAVLTGTVEDSSGPTPASTADLRVQARAWVEGADIDWTPLAVPGDRVPLPPHPFMRRRYWLEMPSFPMAVATGTGRLHRFLDRVEPSMDGAVFVRRFDRTDPVVRDHVVQGRYLVPGVVQLEMVRAAATAAAIPVGQPGTGLPMAGLPVLADIAWPSPFEVPEAGTDARVILRRTGDGIGFEIRVGGDVLVCQGRLVAAVPAAGERLAPAALIARAERHLVAAAIYDRLSTLGLAYGPALRSLTDVWVCGDRVVSALAAPVAEPDVAWLPGVLDGALQSLLGFADTAETRLLVPFALGRVDATGDLAQARFVVGARRQAADGRATFDLTVTDTEGAPLLHLSDLTARSVGSPGAVTSDLPLTLCRPVWSVEPTPLAIAADTVVAIVRDGDDGGIATALARTLGANRVDVVGMDHPAIGEATDLVWVVAPSRDPGQDGPVLAAAAEAAALALLHAIQALDRVGRLGRDLRLRIVTRGLQSVSPREAPDPIAGAVLGVAKCVALEYPRVSVTLTDLDDQALAHPDLAAMILAEPPTLPVREVAWRGGQRHALTMAPFDARGTGEALRPGASVLIVGGAGGIGLELAAWLTREHGARVALVGRRPINEVADRIAAVSSGSGSIRYLQADATDHAAMRDVVEDLRGAWGGIDIAIHAALVLRDRTVARMDEATFRAVLAPKVAGSIALAEALADEPLQVLAFLSSVNVISGSRGQSNYVAGSSFADAYARSLSSTRPWRVVVTDWGLWGDVGVVSDETYRLRLSRLGVHPIRPAEGIATLAAILAGNADRVAVARAEPAALRQLGLAVAPPVADLTGAEAGFAALERHGRVTLRTVLDRLAGEPSGKAWTTEGLRRHLGIAPRHATLFAALLDALGRDGLIGETDGLWRLSPLAPGLADTARAALDRAQQAAPWLAGPRRLLQTCLDAYAALLRGELDPVAVLFPQASMDLVVAAYDGNPIADHFNTEIAAAVLSAVAEAAPGQGLRILELGAGTGSTTAAVLSALVPFRDRVTYVATDVSQRFLAHGQARFATHPNIRFALHDIERDAAANGQEEGSFDLILAANVLHATADLTATLSRTRRLLKPGGRLLLSEATRAQDFGTMVFGLTPGWWRAEDRARRIPFSPLATVASWQALMREAGFATAEAITAGAAATTPHALLVAENREVFVPRIEPAVLAVAQPAVLPRPATVVAAAGGGSLTRLHDHLRTILADVLKLDAHEVRLNESFDRYGLESLTALEVRNRLDRDIPGLPATLLFEHNTLARLAFWLAASHTEAVARLFPDAPSPPMSAGGVTPAPAVGPSTADSLPPSPPSAAAAERPPAPRPAFGHDEPIAIIGFHGRYPGGADADAFWRLLHAGETAITDVPAERWPAGSLAPGFFDPAGGEGTSYTKWAGFIPDVDRFDPLFFAISPLDAEVMDPQERLFLETAWATLEQAGYTSRRLRDVSATDHGGDVGVFVGAMNVPYQWVAAEAWGAGHASAASTNYWSIANRVSFLFDFAGPSMVVDTACSASMTAIHLACESLRRGECGAALAGGVNLILHPRQFINLSQARMVSRGGECRAFGADADGFVDGEGVGAVLLKPLSSALRDGDRIEGVILGTAVNAGGRTSGFTVPNPKAQARVIRAALHRAGVEPGSVSYVEAHGTGTALGDPIEIAGLAEVFAESNRAPCAIGAVKANIGHLESAAGIAGLTKVLLQFRHRTIAPLRHAATPNPLIDLAATPFVLPDAPMAWNPTQPGGRLRAGISSFGAGGANAHLVIEDFPEAPPRSSAADRPDLVVLSARDADRLRAVAEALLAAIRARPVPLQDLAHTLRVGREAMAARLAIHAATLPDLEQKLALWLADHPPAGVLAGSAATGTSRLLAETPEGEALLQGLLARRDFDRLARLWVEGADIDWTRLPVDPAARLVVLPTYPFRRERYWLPVPDAGAGSIEPAVPTVASTDAAPQPAAVDVPADTPAPAQEPALESGADSASEFAQETIGQPVRLQLFARAWQPAAASPHRIPGPVALVSDDDALAESFASLWPSALIRVRTGPAFAIDGPCLRFNPAQEADHAALIAHLARLHPDGFAIVQALDWRGTGAAHDPGVGVRPSILLTQAAQRHGVVPMRIIHLYADAAARPLDEGVAALARSAMQESMACRLRAVGLDGPADVHRAALACRDELISADDAPDVRHGANGRLAPTIEPVAIDPQAATIGFRIGGAYLLVGGLGEVGCAIAERLGRDYRARIAIIGRSKPRGVALARLNQLRDAGILVHYQACDLNDRAGLERALTAIRGQLGRLHGVLHLARTVEDALLVRKSPDSMARVMAAKVEGTITLDEVLAQEELDWFVLCSSLAAWLGLAGGGDYALACAFQNGFARLRQQRVERGERFGRTVAICWPQWRHDRYLNDAKLRQLAAEGLQTIDARDGLRTIAQALQSDRTEVAAIKGAERALHRLTLAYRADTAPMVASPVAMAPPSVAVDDITADLHGLSDAELDAYLAYLRQEVADDVAEPLRLPIVAAPPPPEPRLAAPKPQPVVAEPGVREASAEATVLETICSFLKLPRDRFTAESEFAAFGLDSIKALHVAERLQKLLGVPVDPAMFYEHPRIGAFAQAVAARSNPHAARATP